MGSRHIVGGLRWAALAVIVMVLPLHLSRPAMLPASDPTDDVELWLSQNIDEAGAGTEMVTVSVERAASELVVDLVVTESSQLPPVEQLAEGLASELAEPVRLTIQAVPVQTDQARADSD